MSSLAEEGHSVANQAPAGPLTSDKSVPAQNKEKIEEKKTEPRKALKRVGNFVLGDVLGEGAYGQVREGLRVSEGQKFGQRVAVKIISRRLLRKVRNGQENLKREIKCLRKLKHKNIIQLHEVIDEMENDKVYLVFELANLLSLQDLIDMQRQAQYKLEGPQGAESNAQDPRAIPYPYARNVFKQLMCGLEACHAKGVVHRDIKPSNLQLTSDGIIKIIDFGVAETLDDFSTLDDTEKFAGTPSFQPPEVAQGTRSFSATKVDIWAAGVTLYVMVTASHPFAGDSIAELYTNISTGVYDIPPTLESNASDLIRATMHPEPEKRYTIPEILGHAWCQQEGLQLHHLLPSLEVNTEKKQSLLNRYMEEDDSEEERDEESDDDDIQEERLQFAEALSGKRPGPMNYTVKFNRTKQAKAKALLEAENKQGCVLS
mmetsp:Transcript_66155/g.137868  ORF Transcript_66155/g.137868 Transcript_66155/m.137868 type:complete len:430 (-) Transcript_66155:64-1353(-)